MGRERVSRHRVDRRARGDLACEEWVDETVQDAIDGVLREALVEVEEALEEREGSSSAALDEALEEALSRFEEALQEVLSGVSDAIEGAGARTRGDPGESPRPPTISRSEAILLVKFNISMMTRRHSADTIENTQTLQDVDIDTQAKVEYFKGRLAASVRANLGGSLDETRFQNSLQLSTRSTAMRSTFGPMSASRRAGASEVGSGNAATSRSFG